MKKHIHISNKAFTLIELLIVVAIIAILAAIAVPNFLEAQTRAKVSRVKADQRSIATALESYRVDNNQYPEQGTPTNTTFPFLRNPALVYGAPGNPAIAFRLSTPIAYVSSTESVFTDPFFKGYGVNGTSTVNDTKYYNYSGDYYYGRIYDSTQDGSIPQFQTASLQLQETNQWHLRGRGPDGDYEKRSAGWEDYLIYKGAGGTGTNGDGGISALYDPTNGSISNGDIVRLGSDGVKN